VWSSVHGVGSVARRGPLAGLGEEERAHALEGVLDFVFAAPGGGGRWAPSVLPAPRVSDRLHRMDSAAVGRVVTESSSASPASPAFRAHDPTFYPVEEKLGQDTLQLLILELLRPLVERWYRVFGKPTFVGSDQFIYYKIFHPERVVAPDLYVLPGVPPGRRIKSWKVWKKGIVPSFALEVVASKDPDKDYREAVTRYAELGVSELVLFDPDHELSEDRVRWQRYRKLKRRGFARVEASNADRIKSHVLGCFLRVVGEGDAARVRLFTGPEGDEIFPTQEEAERAAKEAALAAKEAALAANEQERAAKEAALAANERERAAKEAALAAAGQERAAKEAALARVAELEALLAKKGRSVGTPSPSGGRSVGTPSPSGGRSVGTPSPSGGRRR